MAAKLPVLRDETPRYPLRKWEYLFANYWMAEPKTPSKADQIAMATKLINIGRHATTPPRTISYQQLKDLKGRADWQDYCKHLAQGGQEAARAMFISDLPFYMETHRAATELALEKKDYRALAPFTVPAIDRVLPKKEGTNVALEQHIHVNLTPKQLALLETERPAIEADVVAIEPAE